MPIALQVVVVFGGCCGWAALGRHLYQLRKKHQQTKNKVKAKLS